MADPFASEKETVHKVASESESETLNRQQRAHAIEGQALSANFRVTLCVSCCDFAKLSDASGAVLSAILLVFVQLRQPDCRLFKSSLQKSRRKSVAKKQICRSWVELLNACY